MKIAVLGPKGTFSDKAYAEYVALCGDDTSYEPVYYPTIDDVFSAVADGADEEPQLGIVPIENTLDGYVIRTLDLLLEKDVRVIDETMVPVAFSLVGNINCLEDIQTLYVQFKAHGQCRQFINDLKNVKIINTESNMESYYQLENTPGVAAIVPTHIAKEEQNRFVKFDVTDSDYNHTRFIVFTKGLADIGADISGCAKSLSRVNRSEGISKKTTQDVSQEPVQDVTKVRIPAYIQPKVDRPGLLYSILKNFHDNQINLISIMSRPTKQQLGTYNFYIEIDIRCERLMVVYDTLRLVEQDNRIKLLGVYVEGTKND
ncbi:MAG: prephenate dehydratase domain-containing protein [Lachnospiraceae bacterium]|nr:prephenate dehydratase domain-containing protein [Lachnospiraceae bacterium]